MKHRYSQFQGNRASNYSVILLNIYCKALGHGVYFQFLHEANLWYFCLAAVRPESPAPPSLVLVLLPVFGVCLVLGSLMLLGLWRNHKGQPASPENNIMHSSVSAIL